MLAWSPRQVDLAQPRSLSARWIGASGEVRARRRYRFDHISVVIGRGADVFREARAAVERWEMARQGWMRIEPPAPVPARGTQVAVIARLGPLWTTSVNQITAVEDSATHYALAYGTTSDHVAKGEERFDVDLHANEDVTFSITAVSRPGRWWAWLGYPLLRWSQARFRRGAIKAIRAAIDK